MSEKAKFQRGAIPALIAAILGWLFDGFEMGLFPLIGQPALQDLLPEATPIVRGQWFTVIIAVFLVGAATGGVFFGWLGDKLGRVRAMSLAIFTYAIFTGLCAFVTAPWQFAGLRFIASLGMGGEWALGVALVNEIWGNRNRAWIAGMIGAAANVGFLLTGLLSLKLNESIAQVTSFLGMIGVGQETADYLLHNRAWRFLAISGAAPAIIIFFIRLFVDESPKWLEEKNSGRTSHWAAIDLLGVFVAAVSALVVIWSWSPMSPVGGTGAFLITIIGLVVVLWGFLLPLRRYLGRIGDSGQSTPADRALIMKHLLLGSVLAGIALMGTWGSTQQAARWASGLVPPGSFPIIEHTVITTALGAITMAFVAAIAADRFGRRSTYTGLCLLSLASALLFFQTNNFAADGNVGSWFYLTTFLIGGITAAFYGFFPLYFPELFPTSVRATAQGFCYNIGRLLAAIGSLQLANLTGLFSREGTSILQSTANAFSVLSCIYLVGVVVIWLAPETKGKPLA